MFCTLGFIKPGIWELVIILVIVLLLFGAKRLPQIGSAVGEAIRGFKKSVKGFDEADEEKKTEADKSNTQQG